MKSSTRGQTVFELVVALGVGIIIVTALVRVVTIAVRNATFAKEQALATRYAQEGIEWVRAQRDEMEWNDLLSKSNVPKRCINTSPPTWDSLFACGSNSRMNNPLFWRELELTEKNLDGQTGNETIEATVFVYWESGGIRHSSKMSTRLTDWSKQ